MGIRATHPFVVTAPAIRIRTPLVFELSGMTQTMNAGTPDARTLP
jgi:hypothetical protein